MIDDNSIFTEDLIQAHTTLQNKCAELEQELNYCKDCLNAVLTGNMPERASLEQFSLALHGRKIAKLLTSKPSP